MQEVSRSEALRIRPSEDGGIRPGFVVKDLHGLSAEKQDKKF